MYVLSLLHFEEKLRKQNVMPRVYCSLPAVLIAPKKPFLTFFDHMYVNVTLHTNPNAITASRGGGGCFFGCLDKITRYLLFTSIRIVTFNSTGKVVRLGSACPYWCCSVSHVSSPRGLTFTWWVCYGFCLT